MTKRPAARLRWEPRYLAYANAHGRMPPAQLAADQATNAREAFRPFLRWCYDQLMAFRTAHPEHFRHPNHDLELKAGRGSAFTSWLVERYSGSAP